MSGPKSVSYRVESAEERARRELAEARAAQRTVRERVERLIAQAGGDAARAGKAPRVMATDEIDTVRAQTAALLAHAERLDRVILDRSVARATAQVQAALGAVAVDLDIAVPVAEPARTADPDVRREAGLEDVVSHLATLPEAERAPLVARVLAAQEELTRVSPARAIQIIASLRGAVADALRADAARASFERRRRALELEFADVLQTVPGSGAMLAAASDDATLQAARRQLSEERERLDREADRRFVLAQAMAALRDLGYRVEAKEGPGFDELVARNDSWRHHGLRLVLPVGQSTFVSVPQAYGATDVRDDVAFERASCADVASMCSALAAGGVTTQVVSGLPPGQRPLRREQEQPARRRSVRPLEREL